jgi:CheY-like chemotaxis protein
MVHTSSPPLRVLVVEDDPLMRWAVTETLGAAGHMVVEAANAATARRGVTEALAPFDVILLDYLLPDSHDLTLLADLRRESPTSAIVMITAKSDAMPDLGNSVSALGASLTLTKPVNMSLVEHMVRSVHRAMHRDLRPMVLGCGDHACAMHADATESGGLAADFIADGLGRAERCWYIRDTHTPGTINRALHERGIDVDGQLRRGPGSCRLAKRISGPDRSSLRKPSICTARQPGTQCRTDLPHFVRWRTCRGSSGRQTGPSA